MEGHVFHFPKLQKTKADVLVVELKFVLIFCWRAEQSRSPGNERPTQVQFHILHMGVDGVVVKRSYKEAYGS